MQTPESPPPEPDPEEYGPEPYEPADYPREGFPQPGEVLPGLGARLTWISGLVLALSAFMGWYVGSGEGLQIAVIGWHTGVLGKLVFFIGLALIALVLLREAGIELPATVPESLVVIVLGALATIFVLIRLITIPQELLPADGRGVGIWISLVAALIATGAGIVRAGEEMR
ncbi:MAG TPA: hypothetical protein VFI37_07295 [Gaiellaceae bacterium]|nr:hypothetical protein [Gaiellaceae bacterium]